VFYLTRSESKFDHDEDLKDLAPDTPLMPSFPVQDQDCNYFIGINKHGKVRNAVVVDLLLDPDDLLTEAIETYPGMPVKLLEDYITNTCVAAHSMPKNVVYQCIIEGHRCVLRSLEENRREIVLWEHNDPKNYL